MTYGLRSILASQYTAEVGGQRTGSLADCNPLQFVDRQTAVDEISCGANENTACLISTETVSRTSGFLHTFYILVIGPYRLGARIPVIGH